MSEITQHERVVEDALRTDPLKPAPPDLLPKVMAQVRTQSHVPRFRLGWIDWAVTLFVACMSGLVFVVVNSVPPEVAAYIESELALRAQSGQMPIVVMLFVMGMLVACMLFLAARLFAKRRWSDEVR
jgi:hypothetical protein